MKTFVMILCLFISTSTLAKPQAYLEFEGMWSGLSLNVGEKKYDLDEISQALKADPLAQEYAKKHRRNFRYAVGSLMGALTIAFTYLASVDYENDFQGEIYYGTLLTGVVANSYFAYQSQKYFYKAINQYNGVYSNHNRSQTSGAKNENSAQLRVSNSRLSLSLTF